MPTLLNKLINTIKLCRIGLENANGLVGSHFNNECSYHIIDSSRVGTVVEGFIIYYQPQKTTSPRKATQKYSSTLYHTLQTVRPEVQTKYLLQINETQEIRHFNPPPHTIKSYSAHNDVFFTNRKSNQMFVLRCLPKK
jgi:hypothetical protein